MQAAAALQCSGTTLLKLGTQGTSDRSASSSDWSDVVSSSSPAGPASTMFSSTPDTPARLRVQMDAQSNGLPEVECSHHLTAVSYVCICFFIDALGLDMQQRT
jgi:hypothetical protein